MPTIVRLSDALKICMYAGDHAPPHFHVIGSDGTSFMISLESLQVLRGSYRTKDFTAAVAWASENGDLLARKWAERNERD